MKNKSNSSLFKSLSYPFKGLTFVTLSLSNACYKLVKYSYNGVKYLGYTNHNMIKNIAKGNSDVSKKQNNFIKDENVINLSNNEENLPWRKAKNNSKKGTRNEKPNDKLLDLEEEQLNNIDLEENKVDEVESNDDMAFGTTNLSEEDFVNNSELNNESSLDENSTIEESKPLPWWKRPLFSKKEKNQEEQIEDENLDVEENTIDNEENNNENVDFEQENILEENNNDEKSLNEEEIQEDNETIDDLNLEKESEEIVSNDNQSSSNNELQNSNEQYLVESAEEQEAREFVNKREKRKYEKEQRKAEKLRKKEEKAKAKEERIRKKKEEKAERKRKKELQGGSYINENVKIDKVPLKQKLGSIGAGFAGIFIGLSNKIKNNTFAKNRRNKKDINRKVLLIDFEGKDAEKSDKKLLYEYVARDKNGKIVKDYFNAYSKVEVHSYLLSEGYEVYSIKTNKLIQLLHATSNTNKTKFKNKDLIFFLTQLSTYLKAGIPLVDALRIVARQYKKKNYQKIFRSIIYELSIGENFSSAMEKQNIAFPKLLINMVKTAEMTGSLPEVLDDMAEYYTEAEATRKQMITALTYPSIVLVFSLGVMTFVMLFVVPKFVQIYDTMDGVPLPTITQVILGLSNFIKKYYMFLILGIVLLIFILVYSYKKIKQFRTICQWIAMKLPIFGNVIIYNEVTMFTKTFSSLLAHNVPITSSMEILNQITNNEIYKMLILDTITNLAKGGKISDAFKDHWAFPVPAYEMIVTGEATGELSEMMYKVSNYYQELHKNSVTRIKTFIEPALTIFLTVGVGIIILSVILPMFNMYSAVSDLGE